MKFKVIFLLFNIIIILSFVFIFFMPTLILGSEFSRIFWTRNWYLAIIFFAVIGVLNYYFASNWRFFKFLEAEDWTSLGYHLEEKIYTKKNIRKQYVKTLVDTYIVQSKPESVLKLENFLRENKKELISELPLKFGIPHLVSNEPYQMEEFFREILDTPNCKEREWVSWNLSFALMLQGKISEAHEFLLSIATQTNNELLLLLAIFMLSVSSQGDEKVEQVIKQGKERIKSRFDAQEWQREVDKRKENLQVLILKKLIHDASDWLFEASTQKRKFDLKRYS